MAMWFFPLITGLVLVTAVHSGKLLTRVLVDHQNIRTLLQLLAIFSHFRMWMGIKLGVGEVHMEGC